MNVANDLISKIISLCKRRGFVFQSSEIYGGLKSCYDFGPLGVELKNNIAQEWWKSMVYEKDNIVGLDASIMMNSQVWKASGHLDSFADPLVDCLNCKFRFRLDKAPVRDVGIQVEYKEGGKADGKKLTGIVDHRGRICPNCGSPNLGKERQFNLMFRTNFGPIDPIVEFFKEIKEDSISLENMQKKLTEFINTYSVYLRPETAQSMFVQFLNIQQAYALKIPFGIAQIGKSFRNEIVTEHFIFRSCEFEQMEMEFFIEPGTQGYWLEYWKNERLNWYLRYANKKDNFRLRRHDKSELAHYSDDCYDIEYFYPWGWDELEGIASRTDYDLKKHAQASGVKISYFDQQKLDPKTQKMGWRYVPYVIEPAAGLTRSVLCFLLDAYSEEIGYDANNVEKIRVVLKLHPSLAPIKVAVLPLVKKDGQPEKAKEIYQIFKKYRINVSYDENQSIGKRYAKHDEIGTPYCITVDNQTLQDNTVTVRDRDTCMQVRMSLDIVVDEVLQKLKYNNI